MQMHHLAPAIIAAWALCIGGCQNESAPVVAPKATSTAGTVATDVPEPAAVTSGPLSVAPGRLEACETGAVVAVKWDVRTDHPAVTETEVWTGPSTEKLTLFAASAASGESKTGPWAGPGSIFALRDRANGNELARVVVDGPTCN